MCGICRKIHANDVDFGELWHDMGLVPVISWPSLFESVAFSASRVWPCERGPFKIIGGNILSFAKYLLLLQP